MDVSIPLHSKARHEKPAGYPDRFPVPDAFVAWTTPFPEYDPPYYVAPVVLANDVTKNQAGWADPEDIQFLAEVPQASFCGALSTDAAGRPLNPAGRTGVAGRGLLGKWGPNYAADPIITRINRQTSVLEMLAVQRKDNGQWAIPGGMVDKGEEVSRTLSRELFEETGVHLDMTPGTALYRGYVDDPRNTDHAWMETTAKHLHLSVEIAKRMHLQAGDDARAVRWLPLSVASIGKLYASHSTLVTAALQAMVSQRPVALVDEDMRLIEELLKALDSDGT
jgi:ADP-ribose pyrophosphatase